MTAKAQSTTKVLAGVALGGLVLSIAVEAIDLAIRGPGKWSIAALLPPFEFWAAIGAPAIGLAIELCIVGWQRSALRSLLVDRLPSALSDIAYLVLF